MGKDALEILGDKVEEGIERFEEVDVDASHGTLEDFVEGVLGGFEKNFKDEK